MSPFLLHLDPWLLNRSMCSLHNNWFPYLFPFLLFFTVRSFGSCFVAMWFPSTFRPNCVESSCLLIDDLFRWPGTLRRKLVLCLTRARSSVWSAWLKNRKTLWSHLGSRQIKKFPVDLRLRQRQWCILQLGKLPLRSSRTGKSHLVFLTGRIQRSASWEFGILWKQFILRSKSSSLRQLFVQLLFFFCCYIGLYNSAGQAACFRWSRSARSTHQWQVCETCRGVVHCRP